MDVCNWLADFHKVTIELASEAHRDDAVSISLRGVSLSWTLELLTFSLGLTWDSNGEVIYVGTADEVTSLKQGGG